MEWINTPPDDAPLAVVPSTASADAAAFDAYAQSVARGARR